MERERKRIYESKEEKLSDINVIYNGFFEKKRNVIKK